MHIIAQDLKLKNLVMIILMQNRVIGAFWGPGTYFEVLDKDGNFDDYGDESVMGGYRKGKGQQYKVYIDLKPEQILDTNKSFNDYGLEFSTEEALKFLLNSPLLAHDRFFDKVLKSFFDLKRKYNNFNDIFSKRSALPYLINFIDSYIGSINDSVSGIKTPFKFEKIINSVEKSRFMTVIKQYSERAAEVLGEGDFNPEMENEIKEKVASGEMYQAGAEGLIRTLKYLGTAKKVEQMFVNYLQLFFRIVKISLNKLPMYIFLKWRTSPEDIKWFMKNLGVYGKMVPERGINDANPRQYLIMWKTTGIVKKVGERYKKGTKFSDEIEDEAQAEEIDNMLQYAGA
jgi:hypothetical protein